MFALKAVFLCLSVVAVLGDEGPTRLSKEFESCSAELNHPAIAPERITTIFIPNTQEEKCLLACVLKKVNVIADGKFSLEVAGKQIEKDFQDEPSNINKAKELLDTCAKKTNSETSDCNLAGAVTTCIFDEFKKAGLMQEKKTSK